MRPPPPPPPVLFSGVVSQVFYSPFGAADTKSTDSAPAFRTNSTILLAVVPRTIESSTSNTFFPSISDLIVFSLRRTAERRIGCPVAHHAHTNNAVGAVSNSFSKRSARQRRKRVGSCFGVCVRACVREFHSCV